MKQSINKINQLINADIYLRLVSCHHWMDGFKNVFFLFSRLKCLHKLEKKYDITEILKYIITIAKKKKNEMESNK